MKKFTNNTLAQKLTLALEQKAWEKEEERYYYESVWSHRLASVRSEAETWLRWEIFKRELKPQGLSWDDLSPSHRARIAQAGERAVERELARAKEKGLCGEWLTIG